VPRLCPLDPQFGRPLVRRGAATVERGYRLGAGTKGLWPADILGSATAMGNDVRMRAGLNGTALVMARELQERWSLKVDDACH